MAAGRSTLRKGYSYSGGDYFSCCGIRAMGYGEQLYPREPCTKGEDGMYHPGEFLPRSYGSRRSGAGTEYRWRLLGESVLTVGRP